METKFLNKFFPPAKTAKLRNEINTFYQYDQESLYEAWERFKELLRKCPHHGMELWNQVQTFYNGLNGAIRNNLDAAAGGVLLSKTQEEAYELIEEMASNSSQWSNERNHGKKVMSIQEENDYATMKAQLANLTKQMGKMMSTSNPQSYECCDFCGEGHATNSCPLGNPTSQNLNLNANDVNFVGNYQRQGNNPYSNTYNPGWRNHPNFAWKDNSQGQQQRQQYEVPQSQLQQIPFQKVNQEQPNITMSQLEKTLTILAESHASLTQKMEAHMQETSTAIQRLVVQIGQVALDKKRCQGTFPSQTNNNLNENAKSLEFDEEESQIEVEEPHMEEEEYVEKSKDEETIPYAQIEEEERAQPQVTYARVGYVYIQHENFSKEEADSQETLSQTMEWTHLDPSTPTEGCSERLPIMIPSLVQDQGRFSIPCTIENFNSMALCDLSVSVNLMPLSTYEQLGVESVKPNKVPLLVADKCEKQPRNKLECVFDKVGNLNYSTKSIIVQRYEDMVKLMKKLEFNTHTYLSNVIKVVLWIMPWTKD